MKNLFEKLQEACRKAKVQEIENLLQGVEVNFPNEYREAQKRVCEYLKLAKRYDKEAVEKEIRKPIDQMTFVGLIEIAISMLAVIPEENKNQNDVENI